MEETFNGLFYGKETCDETTFKKALLLYDEINFLDRASFSIRANDGRQAGTIGYSSPMRQFENNPDFNVKCYSPIDGAKSPALYDSIEEDLRDKLFIRTFLKYFLNDFSFYCLFIHPNGKYSGEDGNEVLGKYFVEAFKKINWDEINFSLELFNKYTVMPYDINSRDSLIMTMFMLITEASYFLNSSLVSTILINAVPFTSFEAYNELLKIKYNRAIKLNPTRIPKNVKIDYVAHTVFDEIINPVNLQNRSIEDILKFKNKHIGELQEFRKYLSKLQYQIENETFTLKFGQEIEKLINLELLPLADKYKEDLTRSWEGLYGGLIKGSLTATFVTTVLSGMSLDNLVTIGNIGAITAWMAKPTVDYIISQRRLTRNNGLAYLLKL